MRYVYLFIVTIFLSSISATQSFANNAPYVILQYQLVDTERNKELEKAEKEAKKNKTQTNYNDGSGMAVQQPLRILSGKFNITTITENDVYNWHDQIRRYSNKLTKLKGRKWKIAMPASQVTPAKNQEIIQEILRQLNADAEDKSAKYNKIHVAGWNVYIQEDLIDDSILRKRAVKELKHQLQIIRSRLPNRTVKMIKDVPIWIYKNRPGVNKNVTAYYSPLYKAVVFPEANKLHKLSDVHNAVVLHELAHGYHDIVLGYDNKEIIAAYNNAVKKGLYRNVKTQYGNTAPMAYALTDHKEYFAELSESYFSTKIGSFENDYYPFNRYDLQKYDKKGYTLAKKLWGK